MSAGPVAASLPVPPPQTAPPTAVVLPPRGLGAGQVRAVEYGIIALCLLALFAIFQPWSKAAFSWGCIGVVVGGLLFNIVPLCRPGATAGGLLRAVGIIFLILVVVAGLGIGSAKLYVIWLEANRTVQTP